jgi:hypothetical protein
MLLLLESLIIVSYYLMLGRLKAITSGKSIYYLIIGALRHLCYEVFIMNALREFTEAKPSKD